MAQYRRLVDTIFDILDSNTGEYFTYSKVTEYVDGNAMSNSEVDNVIYVKLGSEYFKRNYTGALNVKWFGAKGDGDNDDTPFIQKAIDLAVVINNDVFFPAGTYLLNSFQTANNGAMISFPDISNPTLAYSVRLYGENRTKLTTSLTSNGTATRSIMFYLYRSSVRVTIENIFFENIHNVTSNNSTAIQAVGTSLNRVTNLMIQDCRFEGFSQDILLQGTVNPVINNCIFNSPKGRDNATSTTAPAVCINMFSNANGQVINPIVRNCQFNGYSGTNITSTTSQALKDGLIVGVCVGGQFYNNYCKNAGVEAIFIMSYTAATEVGIVSIFNNTIDSTPPAGAKRYNGDAQLVTYGIRSECIISVIENNTILNASYGVVQDAQSAGLDYAFNKWFIKNNTISFSTGTNYKTLFGLNIRGFSDTVKAGSGEIKGNTFLFDTVSLAENFSLFALTNTVNFRIDNNAVIVNSFTANSNTCNYLYLNKSNNIQLGEDYINPLFNPVQLVPSTPSSTYAYYNSPVSIVETYVDMISEAAGPRYKKFLVRNDEDKSLPNTLYEYYPGNAILWVSTTIEVDLTKYTMD